MMRCEIIAGPDDAGPSRSSSSAEGRLAQDEPPLMLTSALLMFLPLLECPAGTTSIKSSTASGCKDKEDKLAATLAHCAHSALSPATKVCCAAWASLSSTVICETNCARPFISGLRSPEITAPIASSSSGRKKAASPPASPPSSRAATTPSPTALNRLCHLLQSVAVAITDQPSLLTRGQLFLPPKGAKLRLGWGWDAVLPPGLFCGAD